MITRNHLTEPAIGNAGKRMRATVDYTVPEREWAGPYEPDDAYGSYIIVGWSIAAFVIITATAWCLL